MEDNNTLIMSITDLTEEEAFAMVSAIGKILKENNVQTYEVRVGTNLDICYES